MRRLIFLATLILIEGGNAFPSVKKMNEKDPLGGIETTKKKEGGLLTRAKRNAFQFGLMIWCETNRNPMAYNGYGCHCGIGGKGEPLDEIDRCCLIHDKCYDDIIENNICGYSSAVYLTFYWRSGCSNCASNRWNSACQKALCECDGAAARCFKQKEYTFQSRGKNFNKAMC